MTAGPLRPPRVARAAPAAPPVWRPGEPVEPVAELVARGGILAIPTESSYGLAVDPMSERGVAAVFDLKARSAAKPLPVVIADPGQLSRLGVLWPSPASGGLERLWPAALSLLLAVDGRVPAAAGADRLAVRVPGHGLLRELLAALGMALTATSANLAGEPPILSLGGLVSLLAGRDAMLVDGGTLPGGPPSTLVSVRDGVAEILRRGRVGPAALRRAAPGLEIRGGAFSAAAVEIVVEDSA